MVHLFLTGDKSNKAVITLNTRPALCFPWKPRRMSFSSGEPHHTRPIQYWIQDIIVPEHPALTDSL